ncbi:1933_t:CDS:2, partial [Racocetra persica]
DNNKSPNQEERNNPNDNGPTPNPPTNGDNHDPEKNNDSPLPNSDADIPPIDMSEINNAATTEQAQQEARTQIQKLFTQRLTTNQEIADFVQEMAKRIVEKQLANQNKNNNYSSNSPNKNEILAWSIGGGMGL